MRHIYKKACITHLPRKPAIHLLWAAFEEQQGGCEIKKLLRIFSFSVHLYWQRTFWCVFNQVTQRRPGESWSPWRPQFQVWRWCVSGGLALNVGTATWLKLRPSWESPWSLQAPLQKDHSMLSSWPGSTWRFRKTRARPRRCCLMLSRVTRWVWCGDLPDTINTQTRWFNFF